MIIGKQRHGPTGTVELQFEADVTRFGNLGYRAPAGFLGALLARLYRRRCAGHNASWRIGTRKTAFPASPSLRAAPETGGTLTIDLAAIEANWRVLAHRLLHRRMRGRGQGQCLWLACRR